MAVESMEFSREALAETCKRWHIRRLAVFGSALRDDFRPDSDVDVLVEIEEGHTPGWEIVDIGEDLSEVFCGRYVDIVSPKYLHPLIKDQVLRNAVVLYGLGKYWTYEFFFPTCCRHHETRQGEMTMSSSEFDKAFLELGVNPAQPYACRVEIHFYQQDEVAIFYENDAGSAASEKFGELLFIANYAIRQASNLGPGQLSESIGLAMGMLAANPQDLSCVSGSGASLRLVKHQGSAGRKRFLCQMVYRPEPLSLDLQLNPKGFGLFASGVGYYAPTSIMGVANFFALRRKDDEAYQTQIKGTLAATGYTISSGYVTMGNHTHLAMSSVMSALTSGE